MLVEIRLPNALEGNFGSPLRIENKRIKENIVIYRMDRIKPRLGKE